jgi:phenylpropionate dioxygenase-like ring-hydroxylating dioxygenase large terminal subunit
MNKVTDAKKPEIEEISEPLSDPMIYSVEAYVSDDYVRVERDKLWRKVWLQAGRVEEIPEVGSYISYEILDDSILIVRTAPDQIKAYHNVCQHRGRRLVDTPCGKKNACGKTKQFVCGFHGWRWAINGENSYVLDWDDWKGALTTENTRLTEVRVDTWGGWLWINMDPACEPLRDYLEPAASMLDHFHLENMRFKWRRWGIFDCNWKVALEAFDEVYHVETTHPEFMQFGEYKGAAKAQGKHSNLAYQAPKGLEGNRAKIRLGKGDARVSTAEMQSFIISRVNAVTTQTLVDAAQRLVNELPAGTSPDKVLAHWIESARRDDEARGIVWPTVDPDVVAESGTSWQIFPNFQIGHAVNNALCYNARPHGYDPNKCVFEVSVFELFPKGQEPMTEWLHTPVGDPAWSTVLPQDFSNMAAVQQGMKSLGFKGPRPNPLQERAVTSLHQNLAEYMGAGAPRALKS